MAISRRTLIIVICTLAILCIGVVIVAVVLHNRTPAYVTATWTKYNGQFIDAPNGDIYRVSTNPNKLTPYTSQQWGAVTQRANNNIPTNISNPTLQELTNLGIDPSKDTPT